MPCRLIGGPRRQDGEPARQPGQERRRRQQADPRRRQFDRQRQAVEARADGGDRPGVRLRQREVRLRRPRPRDEERHGGIVRQGRRRLVRGGIRERQRAHRVDLLGPQPQPFPARHQQPESRAALQQRGHGRGRRGEVLEIVEDQQDLPLPEDVVELVDDRTLARLTQTERLRDRRQDRRRIADRGERHEVGAIRVSVRDRARHRERQPGLADAARPDKRQQTARLGSAIVAQERRRRGDVVVAADQRRRRNREERSAHRCRLRPIEPPRDGRTQRRPLLFGQPQRGGERLNRGGVGMAALAALQGADRVGTETGAFGQLLLRQTGGLTHVPQPVAEGDLSTAADTIRPSAHCSPAVRLTTRCAS